MARGTFITFEGGEGVGKTTQIQKLADHLKADGHDVVLTREPGGTPAAEEIRNLLSHPDYGGKWDQKAEMLMMFVARAMHVRDLIAPALKAGKTVVCDRYIDSTRVYQGNLQNLGYDLIHKLEDEIVGDYRPDITIILDLDASKAMERVQSRGAEDHYDRESLEFYTALREGFLEIAQNEPDRCLVINADDEADKIAETIYNAVKSKLSN